jgi:microcystin-dependent protein
MSNARSLAATVAQADRYGFVPPGVCLAYALATAPTGWLMCYGQALVPGDASTAALRAALLADGSPYGTSGSDPLVPDGRGRGIVGKDNMGGTAVNRVTTAVSGLNGAALGAVGGDQRAQGHSHAGSIGSGIIQLTGAATGAGGAFVVQSDGSNQTIGTTNAGASQNMAPSIILNTIIKL